MTDERPPTAAEDHYKAQEYQFIYNIGIINTIQQYHHHTFKTEPEGRATPRSILRGHDYGLARRQKRHPRQVLRGQDDHYKNKNSIYNL
jgi:hypothetical protein